jgi:hypothetical protein
MVFIAKKTQANPTIKTDNQHLFDELEVKKILLK